MMNTNHRKKTRACVHEHAGSLHELITTLQNHLTTASIMTPWAQVDFVVGETDGPQTKAKARELMDQYQYSGIPMVSSDCVIGAYTRRDPSCDPSYEIANSKHFVKSDFGLIDLIRHMRDSRKTAVGVGSPTCPSGWLSYADFSKRPFRVLLFAIVAEVEYLIAHALDLAHADNSWIHVLADSDQEKLCRRQKSATEWDVTMPMTTFAELGQLTQALARSSTALGLLGETTEVAKRFTLISRLRNRVAHVVKPIVAGPSQIAEVANQIELMLNWIQIWSQALATVMTGPNTASAAA